MSPRILSFKIGEHRVGTVTAPGDEDRDDPPPEPKQHRQEPSNSRPRRAKDAALFWDKRPSPQDSVTGTTTIYVCAACGFIQWVAVSTRF
jgi:hypothetical protein